MRNKPRCGLFTCALTILGALLLTKFLTTTLLLHNYVEKQYHVLRGPASRQAALRDARDAAAALVDAVTRPPTPEGAAENRQLEIVRGAGNATRHLHRFSELGGDRHLRGPMRQRVVSDTMHHRLVRQAHASLQAPTNAIKFMEANCSTQEACRERFRYPDHHAVECSNATRGFEYLVDLRCGHPCEKAFFHRIESCMQPMYALLRLARATRGAAALVERSGWLSGGLEEVFWTELEPVSELLRYDDRSRGVTQWDGCWDRTGAPLPLICFNVDAGAKVLVPGRASQEAPPTEASLLLHADLLRLGLYPQEPRRPLSPVVIAVQRHESRSFLNFSGLIAELSTQFRGSILTYHGNESLRETIELFGRASVAVWKSKFYGAFVLNHRVVLHAIDATPARWRGDAGSSPLDRARSAASSPRNDLVKNCRAPDALVDFHTGRWSSATTAQPSRTCCFRDRGRRPSKSSRGPAATITPALIFAPLPSRAATGTSSTLAPRAQIM